MRKKRLLLILGIPIALLAVLYLGRRLWFESLVAGEIRSNLEPMLGAEIEVGAIRGNWLTELVVEDVSIRGKATSAYREVRGLRIVAGFSPWTLLGGDARGLLQLQVEVEHVSLALDQSFGKTGAPTDPATAGPPLAELLDILPAGATVRIKALQLHPAVAITAPCTIQVAAGTGTRRLELEFGASLATASLTPTGNFAVESDAEGLGRVIRELGWSETTTDAGTLSLRMTGNLTPLQVEASLSAAMQLRDGRQVGARGKARWHDGRLQVSEVAVDLPGIVITGNDLDVPLARLSKAAIEQMLQERSGGSLELTIADLAPYQKWLPPTVVRRLPIRGKIALDVRRGVVEMRRSRLEAAGLDLTIDAGSFSLIDLSLADFSAQKIRGTTLRGFAFSLDIARPLQFDVGDGLTLQGNLTGTVAGSLEKPEISAKVGLGATSYGGFRCSSLAGEVRYDATRVVAENLRVAGLQRAGDNFAASLDGGLTIHFATADQPMRLEARAQGEVPREALALADLPTEIRAALTPPGYEVKGDVSFPAGQAARGTLELELPELRYDGLAPLQLITAVAFSGTDFTVRRFDLKGEQGELHATGQLSPQSLDLRVHGAVRALGPIVKVAGLAALDGRLTLRPSTLRGPLRAPAIDLDATLTLASIDPAWLPAPYREHLPLAPLGLEVQASSGTGGVTVRKLELDWGDRQRRWVSARSQGIAPLAWTEAGFRAVTSAAPLVTDLTIHAVETVPGQPPVDLTCRIEWTDQQITAPTLQLRSANGVATGTALRTRLPTADLLAGSVAWPKLEIEGRIDIKDLPIGAPLNRLMTGIQVSGNATAQLSFAGPASRPKIGGQLDIAAGTVAYGDAPELRGVEVQAKFTEHRASLSARGGFGTEQRMVVTAWVDSGKAPLWRALQTGDLPLTGRVDIEDLDLAIVPPKLTGMQELQGVLSLHGSLSGTARDPQPELVVGVDNGAWRSPHLPPVDALKLRATLRRDRIELTECTARAYELPLKITADVGVTGTTLWKIEPDTTLSGYVALFEFPLNALPKKLTGLDDLAGNVQGKLKLGGTRNDPRPELDLQLTGGALKVAQLPRLDALDIKVVADRARCTIRGTGAMGAAPVTLTCDLQAAVGTFEQGWRNAGLRASITGDRLLLMRGSGLKIRGDLDLTAAGTMQKIKVDGKIATTEGSKFIKRLSLVPDLKVRGGAGDAEVFGPWAFPGGERFTFDVQILTQAPMSVRTNVIDTDLDIGCRLVGQGNALHLAGVSSSRRGTLRFPGMSMRVQGLRLMFNEANPTRPSLIATATGQRHGIRINLRVTGSWDDPVVNLSSTPALQPKELWALVTTGQRPASLAEGSAQSNTTLIATYVIQELLLTYLASESTEERESFITRFTFEFGNEISRGGQETWKVNFDLGKLWVMPERYGLRLERDVYEDINLGIVYRWRF